MVDPQLQAQVSANWPQIQARAQQLLRENPEYGNDAFYYAAKQFIYIPPGLSITPDGKVSDTIPPPDAGHLNKGASTQSPAFQTGWKGLLGGTLAEGANGSPEFDLFHADLTGAPKPAGGSGNPDFPDINMNTDGGNTGDPSGGGFSLPGSVPDWLKKAFPYLGVAGLDALTAALAPKRESFSGTDLDPVKVGGQALDALHSSLGAAQSNLQGGVHMRSSFAQRLPSFGGPGLPMNIGVTAHDPALDDQSLLHLQGPGGPPPPSGPMTPPSPQGGGGHSMFPTPPPLPRMGATDYGIGDKDKAMAAFRMLGVDV